MKSDTTKRVEEAAQLGDELRAADKEFEQDKAWEEFVMSRLKAARDEIMNDLRE